MNRVVLLCALLAHGCGTDSPSTPDAGPTSYTTQWGPLVVDPGVEDVRCVHMRLGNIDPVRINTISNSLGGVSHHLILYKSTETEEVTEPYRCESIENLVDTDSGVPLMITQKAEETLVLPPGIAFELEANQMIRMELHYINASDEAKEVTITSTFTPIPEEEFEHAADLLFIGNPDIDIPANSTASLNTYFQMPSWLDGVNYFGITGHVHQWGLNVTVASVADENDGGSMVYDLPAFNWSEPETVYHSPPFQTPSGGGFRFACNWDNQSSQRVRFGEGANDEMCFFWAYYYPSRGAYTCFHTEQFQAPLDICCPGHQLCNLVDQF